ncbi:hypothetical protein PHSC3_000255 [Chlamydiales bacterium STE3]|nr:hypothetical protein PHSC3_000255 [Chlamydiales bacterium STE3]
MDSIFYSFSDTSKEKKYSWNFYKIGKNIIFYYNKELSIDIFFILLFCKKGGKIMDLRKSFSRSIFFALWCVPLVLTQQVTADEPQVGEAEKLIVKDNHRGKHNHHHGHHRDHNHKHHKHHRHHHHNHWNEGWGWGGSGYYYGTPSYYYQTPEYNFYESTPYYYYRTFPNS